MMREGKMDDAHGKSLIYALDVLGRAIVEQVNEKKLAELEKGARPKTPTTMANKLESRIAKLEEKRNRGKPGAGEQEYYAYLRRTRPYPATPEFERILEAKTDEEHDKARADWNAWVDAEKAKMSPAGQAYAKRHERRWAKLMRGRPDLTARVEELKKIVEENAHRQYGRDVAEPATSAPPVIPAQDVLGGEAGPEATEAPPAPVARRVAHPYPLREYGGQRPAEDELSEEQVVEILNGAVELGLPGH